jgi:hypothetical protein
MCVSECKVFKIRVKYAPSSKITQTYFFLSYYSLLIIWHAVQCFWFQTSIKCTRKWRKFYQYRNSQASIIEFRNKHGNGDEFPDFVDLFFFFGMKNVRVDRKHTYFFLWPKIKFRYYLTTDFFWNNEVTIYRITDTKKLSWKIILYYFVFVFCL